MGLFKAYRDTMKEVHEIDKTWDPGKQRKEGMARMSQMQDQMAEMTKQANLQATGVTCAATVTSVTDTGGMVNMQPILEIELTVLPDGLPPYPVKMRQTVSPVHLARIQPGASLSVKVDPNDPSSVFIDMMASMMQPPASA